MTEKQYFVSHCTILYDTREKGNFELLKELAHIGVNVRQETFTTADYSFEIDGKSYKAEWLAERKGSLSEVYSNVMARNRTGGDLRNNLEEEVDRAKTSGVVEFTVFIEGVDNLAQARNYKNGKADKQGSRAGEHIYSTLLAWQCNNRYGFKIVCARTQREIAIELLNYAYYYWRNDMKQQHGDKFLSVLTAQQKASAKN